MREAGGGYDFTDYGDTAEGRDNPDPMQLPEVLCMGLRGPVGSGKTKDLIQHAEDVLTPDPAAVGAVFVPDHALAQEMAHRLEDKLGPGMSVGIWRGREQPDPANTDQKMCQRHEDANAVTEAGGKLADLCGSKGRGFCRFHPDVGGTCGYVAQGRARHRVWVLTHAMLGHAAPAALMRHAKDDAGKRVAAADLVLIDEAFWTAMLGGFGEKPYAVDLADLIWPGWTAAVPDKPGEPGQLRPTGASAARQLMGVLAALHGVLAGAALGVGIAKVALAGGGLTEASCHEAWVHALSCKKKMPATLPTAAPGSAAGALGAAADNRRVMRVARLLKVTADVLGERTGPAALRVIEDKAGTRRAALRWREGIHRHWLEAPRGIIHADATMEEAIAKAWLPHLDVQRMPPAAAPHMRVVQVEDRKFGYSAVLERPYQGLDGKEAAASNTQRIRRMLDELAARYKEKGGAGGPDVLAVLPKDLESKLAKAGLPLNVGRLHFGKLRGQDSFKDVAALVVVSRPEPPARAVEDMAEIIFGRGVDRQPRGAFYDKRDTPRVMADGTAREARAAYHPDPHAEAVRWACCEAELVQAIGRGRGIHRKVGNPLTVFVLTNVPLDDVPVFEVCTLDDIWKGLAGESPVLELLKAGVLPLDWPGIGAGMAALGFLKKGVADPGEAAKKRFSRDPLERAALDDARRGVVRANGGCFSYCSSIGETSPIRTQAPWVRWTYRRPGGSRKAAAVLVSPDHPDARTAAEALLGPLARFDAAPKAPRSARERKPACLPPPTAVSEPPPISVQEDAPVMPAAPATLPDQQAELEARLAATPLGLPPVLNALTRQGCLSAADRHRHMNRFRMDRGPHDVRERRALVRLAQEVGRDALTAAAMAAARTKLGLPDREATA